jgi:hypothetical protein
LGVALLLFNDSGLGFENWWAFFILLPAIGSLKKGLAMRTETGHFPQAAREAVGWGVIMMVVALFFLIGLSWNMFWPIILIVVGMIVIVNKILK